MPLSFTLIDLDGFDAIGNDTINGIEVLLLIEAVTVAIFVIGHFWNKRRHP